MSSRKDFPVQIGEKTFFLRYNYDALCLIEDMTGHPFAMVLQADSLKNRKILLYAGLVAVHDDVTFDRIGVLMDEADDLAELFKSMVDAINNYFTKGKTEQSKKKKEVAVKESPSTTKTDA